MSLSSALKVRKIFWIIFGIFCLDVALLIVVALLERSAGSAYASTFNLAIGVLGVAWIPIGCVLLCCGVAYLTLLKRAHPGTATSLGERLSSFGKDSIASSLVLVILGFLPERVINNSSNYLVAALAGAAFGIALILVGAVLYRLESRPDHSATKQSDN
jgi:hypothetical protein